MVIPKSPPKSPIERPLVPTRSLTSTTPTTAMFGVAISSATSVPATPTNEKLFAVPETSAAATSLNDDDGRQVPSTVTPPSTISPAAMTTSDPEQKYFHDPAMPEELVPNEQLRFESREEAKGFYYYYARMAGFGVRITKTHPTVGEFSCKMEGKWDFYKKGEERKTNKTSMRTKCKAFVKTKWTKKKGYWFFDRINLEHNHKLTPSEEAVKFMAAHKNKDPVIMEMVDQWNRNSVPPNCTLNLLSDMYGGRQNISFTEMDLKNRRAEAAREERKNDIPKLLEFFKEMRAHNEHFYYDLQVDENNVIQNVFWSHASQRADYVDFGDVVTFDTTYRTNIYSMPLAMFVGSNHQLQNVIFGQALLHNEQTDTFEWLFKTFKNCMQPQKEPRCILTDQDSSMAAAIKKVFLKTIHRLCRWHMLKKYKEELKKLYGAHEGLKEKLHMVINHPLTPEEFEVAWNALVDEFGIRENVAINSLWKQRELWISAYFKQYYCGRMTTTQRSESVNKLVKCSGFANEMTSVNKFARKLLHVIQHTNHTAAGETHWSQAKIITATLQSFDLQLSRLYTRAVYKNYKDTYMRSTAFHIEVDRDRDNGYLVTHTKESRKYSWYQHSFKVLSNVEAGLFQCECRTWEHTGLFCEHLLKAFTHLQIKKVPSQYILKRYTKDARHELMWDRHDIVTVGPDCTTAQFRTSKLVTLAMAAVRACSKSMTGFEMGCERFEALRKLVESIPADIGPSAQGNWTNEESFGREETMTGSAPNVVEDIDVSMSAPQPAKTKGSRSRGKEISCHEVGTSHQKAKKRTRQCHTCGLYAGHYSTTCPLNQDVAARGRGRRGTMGTKRGRPQTKRQLEQEFMLTAGEEETDEEWDAIGDE